MCLRLDLRKYLYTTEIMISTFICHWQVLLGSFYRQYRLISDEKNDEETGTYNGIHVTWGYHITHCIFMWRKLQRAMIAGNLVDSHIGSLEHTVHCADRFVESVQGILEENAVDRHKERPSWDDRRAQFLIKFPTCKTQSHNVKTE
jgi:hypothetical protein